MHTYKSRDPRDLNIPQIIRALVKTAYTGLGEDVLQSAPTGAL